MAPRPLRAILPSSILVVVLLFHFQVVADSSRTLSTEEQRRPIRADRPTAPAAVVVHRAEPHRHRDGAEEIGTGRVAVETTTEDDGSRTSARAEEGGAATAAAAALPATAATTSVRGKDGQGDDGVGGSRNGRPVASAVLLRSSRLARRFLADGAVEGAADSAAKPSCGSNNVHNGCTTPPSEH